MLTFSAPSFSARIRFSFAQYHLKLADSVEVDPFVELELVLAAKFELFVTSVSLVNFVLSNYFEQLVDFVSDFELVLLLVKHFVERLVAYFELVQLVNFEYFAKHLRASLPY